MKTKLNFNTVRRRTLYGDNADEKGDKDYKNKVGYQNLQPDTLKPVTTIYTNPKTIPGCIPNKPLNASKRDSERFYNNKTPEELFGFMKLFINVRNKVRDQLHDYIGTYYTLSTHQGACTSCTTQNSHTQSYTETNQSISSLSSNNHYLCYRNKDTRSNYSSDNTSRSKLRCKKCLLFKKVYSNSIWRKAAKELRNKPSHNKQSVVDLMNHSITTCPFGSNCKESECINRSKRLMDLKNDNPKADDNNKENHKIQMLNLDKKYREKVVDLYVDKMWKRAAKELYEEKLKSDSENDDQSCGQTKLEKGSKHGDTVEKDLGCSNEGMSLDGIKESDDKNMTNKRQHVCISNIRQKFLLNQYGELGCLTNKQKIDHSMMRRIKSHPDKVAIKQTRSCMEFPSNPRTTCGKKCGSVSCNMKLNDLSLQSTAKKSDEIVTNTIVTRRNSVHHKHNHRVDSQSRIELRWLPDQHFLQFCKNYKSSNKRIMNGRDDYLMKMHKFISLSKTKNAVCGNYYCCFANPTSGLAKNLMSKSENEIRKVVKKINNIQKSCKLLDSESFMSNGGIKLNEKLKMLNLTFSGEDMQCQFDSKSHEIEDMKIEDTNRRPHLNHHNDTTFTKCNALKMNDRYDMNFICNPAVLKKLIDTNDSKKRKPHDSKKVKHRSSKGDSSKKHENKGNKKSKSVKKRDKNNRKDTGSKHIKTKASDSTKDVVVYTASHSEEKAKKAEDTKAHEGVTLDSSHSEEKAKKAVDTKTHDHVASDSSEICVSEKSKPKKSSKQFSGWCRSKQPSKENTREKEKKCPGSGNESNSSNPPISPSQITIRLNFDSDQRKTTDPSKCLFCCCQPDCSFKESLKRMFCISFPSSAASETKCAFRTKASVPKCPFRSKAPIYEKTYSLYFNKNECVQ